MHPTRASSNAFPFDLSRSDPHRANAEKPSPRSAPGTRESFPVPPARPNSEPSNRNPWMHSAQSSRFPVPPARPNSVRMPSPTRGHAEPPPPRRALRGGTRHAWPRMPPASIRVSFSPPVLLRDAAWIHAASLRITCGEKLTHRGGLHMRGPGGSQPPLRARSLGTRITSYCHK